MQFYQKALELSRLCGDNNEQYTVLVRIAGLNCKTGDYCTAQVHIAETLRLSKLVPNLLQEATALWIEALCSTYLGNFLQAIDNLHRGRTILGMCGLAEGDLDHTMAIQRSMF
jgi:hypothetical protein